MTLNITTLSIMTLSIMGLFVKFSATIVSITAPDTVILSVVMPSVANKPGVIMLSVVAPCLCRANQPECLLLPQLHLLSFFPNIRLFFLPSTFPLPLRLRIMQEIWKASNFANFISILFLKPHLHNPTACGCCKTFYGCNLLPCHSKPWCLSLSLTSKRG